ncbi:ABC transporter ATP-binding protein [bacterium]|nr:ABC transporter ATP-binding protein [bacterium]
METIVLRNITKAFTIGEIKVEALRGITLTIHSGEFVAIVGTSGSGKSTLMNVLGALDQSSSGDYYLDGVYINQLNKKELSDVRNEKIGFVFQGYNLLARTTALDNVELPLIYARGKTFKNIHQLAEKALEQVGLANRLHHEPNQLSGGQQQRVAIARALVNQPSIILADEPTGNLDSKTTTEILALFQHLNNQGKTIVLVTHDLVVAAHTKRIVEISDGLIICDEDLTNRRIAEALSV